MFRFCFASLGKHFHVPKQDLFHRLPFKTVWSHLSQYLQPYMVHPWARLLYQMRCVSTLTGARNLVRVLRDSGVAAMNYYRSTNHCAWNDS